MEGLAVQPGNGLAPFDAFPFRKGAGTLEGDLRGNMYSGAQKGPLLSQAP